MIRLRLAAALVGLISVPAFGYGAIAIDQKSTSIQPGYGYSKGQPDQATAERVAKQFCDKYNPNGECKTIMWFKTCGAYVNSEGYYGYGYGDTKTDAINSALEQCNPEAGACKLVIAACDDDPN
ncbi:DUF4189 domain-containing protein [Novosphingobium sp.]|uniref:DUF4189 domain-containing protein n=1 Tax=Novosphingobium sp. TaxID=1874826 RepID=UPI0035B39DD7